MTENSVGKRESFYNVDYKTAPRIISKSLILDGDLPWVMSSALLFSCDCAFSLHQK